MEKPPPPPKPGMPVYERVSERLVLDEVVYRVISTNDVASGVVGVPIMDETVGRYMFAGHIGYQVLGEKKDTVQPLPAWFIK